MSSGPHGDRHRARRVGHRSAAVPSSPRGRQLLAASFPAFVRTATAMSRSGSMTTREKNVSVEPVNQCAAPSHRNRAGTTPSHTHRGRPAHGCRHAGAVWKELSSPSRPASPRKMELQELRVIREGQRIITGRHEDAAECPAVPGGLRLDGILVGRHARGMRTSVCGPGWGLSPACRQAVRQNDSRGWASLLSTQRLPRLARPR